MSYVDQSGDETVFLKKYQREPRAEKLMSEQR